MIDFETFAQAMGYLGERFNRVVNPPLIRAYYEILSPELSVDEFRIGVKLALRYARFWPAPQEIIDYVRPPEDPTLEAAKCFEDVRKCGESHPSAGMIWRRDKIALMGDAALAGFDAIGANEGLKNLEAKYLAITRREFIDAYVRRSKQLDAQEQIAAAKESLIESRERRALKGAPVSIGEIVLSEAARIS